MAQTATYAMATCPHCKKYIPEGRVVCPYCGKKIGELLGHVLVSSVTSQYPLPRSDSLDLQVGDYILWQGEDVYTDQTPFLRAGMVGRVVMVEPGIPEDDPLAQIVGESILERVMVEFENGMQILVDDGMKWEKVREQ